MLKNLFYENALFSAIHSILTGLKGLLAMGSCNSDNHDNIPHLNPTHPVTDSRILKLPIGEYLFTYLSKLLLRPLLIALTLGKTYLPAVSGAPAQ